jgi:hypothetical protein
MPAIPSAGISIDIWLIESNVEMEYLTEDERELLEQIRKNYIE